MSIAVWCSAASHPRGPPCVLTVQTSYRQTQRLLQLQLHSNHSIHRTRWGIQHRDTTSTQRVLYSKLIFTLFLRQLTRGSISFLVVDRPPVQCEGQKNLLNRHIHHSLTRYTVYASTTTTTTSLPVQHILIGSAPRTQHIDDEGWESGVWSLAATPPSSRGCILP